MRNLNLDQLQTLIVIADLGTLAAAAQALHLAPPTIGMHINELESRLGVTLVHRGRRQARLTAAGAALVENGRRILKSTDDAVEQVRRFAQGSEGKVRLGASAGVVANLLPQVLELLAERNPGIDIELDVLGSAEIMRQLNAGALDIGIVALPQIPGPEVQVSAWRSDPMVAFLPRQWKAPKVITPQWLAQRPLISISPKTQMYRLTAAWFGKAGLHPRARTELDFPVAIKGLVAAGYGAAILPKERPDDARLHARMQLRPLNPPLMRQMGYAHRIPKLQDAATREVLKVLSAPPFNVSRNLS